MSALARAIMEPDAGDFPIHELRIFTSIPCYHHGVVVLRGLVAVYETDLIGREGIIEGAFYVRESQWPVASMEWETWLKLESEDRTRRAGPRSPLQIRREVVRVVRWPLGDNWALRLESGFTDGPYQDWAFGLDLIGKVTGVYLPVEKGGCS